MVALVLTVLVSISRVYLAVHYPTDVLAGWSAAAPSNAPATWPSNLTNRSVKKQASPKRCLPRKTTCLICGGYSALRGLFGVFA
jgi:membrane-associated phospholipid phosphatase